MMLEAARNSTEQPEFETEGDNENADGLPQSVQVQEIEKFDRKPYMSDAPFAESKRPKNIKWDDSEEECDIPDECKSEAENKLVDLQ